MITAHMQISISNCCYLPNMEDAQSGTVHMCDYCTHALHKYSLYIYIGAKPTLKMLMSFPTLVEGMRKNLDIIQKTSLSYVKLGTFLLEDDNCDIVDSLKEQCQSDPVNITRAIYKKWISGTGRKPLTWQTLVDVLAEIELCSVADEIKRCL